MGEGPKAYLAIAAESAAKDGYDFTKPPANEKEARARPNWPLWKQAIKEEVAAHKKLGTWSTIKGSNKQHKAVKTRFVLEMKNDAEGEKKRYKARLVAQGSNQVTWRDFDETRAPVPHTATSRALFAVAAAKGQEVHHVDVKTDFQNAMMGQEIGCGGFLAVAWRAQTASVPLRSVGVHVSCRREAFALGAVGRPAAIGVVAIVLRGPRGCANRCVPRVVVGNVVGVGAPSLDEQSLRRVT